LDWGIVPFDVAVLNGPMQCGESKLKKSKKKERKKKKRKEEKWD
jgi:hypothetical protein